MRYLLNCNHFMMLDLLKLPDHPSSFSFYYAQAEGTGAETSLELEIEQK